MDYTDLNEACLKDSFPFPRIDQIIDVSAGQGMLSFLDAFSGYYQIPMHPPDVEKTDYTARAILLQHNAFRFEKMLEKPIKDG